MDWELFAKELKKVAPDLELLRKEPMSRHTTFRVGGAVALLAVAKTEEEAQATLRVAAQHGVEPFFLGNGSNLLVADEGYDGFLVKLSGDLNQVRDVDGELVAGGATLLSRLANAALEQGLTGLEFASGIPGTVGGAVTMNAGAYGGEIAQVLKWVKAIDFTGEVRTIPVENCDLSYRHSAFSDGKRLILEAGFRLESGDRETIRAAMQNFAARRKAKQPLEYPSAGSTFKRPEGHFAAALIEQCGLKGLTVGGAQVSEKHAGFVINKGGATCADIFELTEQIKSKVLDKTGVTLELEIKTLGV